jgi:23S rRNA (adenine2503-C2)-methyltransferase
MAVSLDLTDNSARDARGASARAALADRPTLIGLTRPQLAEALKEAGVPERQVKMRVQQLWHWLYIRGVSDFDDMTNVSKDLRAMLKENFSIARPEIVEEQVSADGTRKWLLRFPPRGAGKPVEVEAVYIPEEDRGTLCVSSQVGCTLTCTFCHTGTQKLVRNLTAEEIVGRSSSAATISAIFPTTRRRAPSCRRKAARSPMS